MKVLRHTVTQARPHIQRGARIPNVTRRVVLGVGTDQ